MRDDTSGNELDVTLRGFVTGQKLFRRYTLIRILGRGGMGIVWLARDEELERELAVKFLPDPVLSDQNFLRELKRETKRNLELTHKNIVRVYDFVYDEHAACISMEYVDGDTLLNCRAQKEHNVFEPEEIADWTGQACDALHYAHHHARIVHRDLKPANLMVNQKGELKITDFGIARSLGDSASRVTLERISGTLVYMSPQQHEGERSTHLDDIYAFGATLYDLLTSTPPFYSGNVDHQIRERIPPSMTKRRKDLNIEPASVAAVWEEVVAACLEKNPSRRPQSMSEIAHRLHLATTRTTGARNTAVSVKGERLSAAGAALLSAINRWKWGVAVAAGLVAVFALVGWQLRSQAEIKAEMAKLRQGILEYPRVETRLSKSETESDPAAVQERVYAELGQQLDVDPKILREKLLQSAEEWRRAPNASKYERANASYVAKDYAESERLALEAAGDAGKVLPSNSKSIIQALELAGLAAHKGIKYERAMEHFREAERFTDRNRNLEEWAALQHEMAELLFDEGKYGAAEDLFRAVIEARTRALGPEHPDTLDSRHRLIYTLTRQTKLTEAEVEAREVLQLREKVLGLEHPDTLTSRSALAHVLANEGKNEQAEALYREIITLDEKTLGSEHSRTVAAREGLADVLLSEGKNDEAETLYRQIIRFDEKALGPKHPTTLNDQMNLATALQANGKYPEAEAQYRDVIKLKETVVGLEHPDTLISRNNLAEALDDDGKYAEAEAECREIIGVEQRVLGRENLTTLNSRGNLAVALIGQGKLANGEEQYKDVLTLMERALGLDHPDTVGYTAKFAIGLSLQHRLGEAKEIANGAAERALRVLGPDNPSTQKYAKLAQDIESTPNK